MENVKDKNISGGSFKTLNLLPFLQKAILRKGFLNPTPIQRKAIPPLLQGKDVIAMARTGSGKTAAFAIPIIQKLKSHSPKVGTRALVLSPTRELAMQLASVVGQLAKFTDLRITCIVGGDSLEDQYSLLASNPDIIIATPGRLLHIFVEAHLTLLKTVQFFVIDEADRMFEMGFASQVRLIIDLMNGLAVDSIDSKTDVTAYTRINRQTALLSATLPNEVAQFARYGLVNPEFIRLDAETKLSDDLKTFFLHTKSDFKDSALIYCLQNLSTFQPKSNNPKNDIQCLIFVSTKHHAEYLNELLKSFSFSSGCIYGSMDQEARVDTLEQFKSRQLEILIVTDLAARGLDIPFLDIVINYDFPPRAKLFVHRSGRVARAGRLGSSISLVSPDEVPYFLDLQIFLGSESILGSIPQTVIDEILESITKKKKLTSSASLEDLYRVMKNSIKMYLKTRPQASPESYTRAKTTSINIHPIFGSGIQEKENMLKAISLYKRTHNLLNIIEISGKAKNINTTSNINKSEERQKSNYYLSYLPSNSHEIQAEKAYAIEHAVLDLKGDDKESLKKKQQKSFSSKSSNKNKDIYDKWKQKTHLVIPKAGETESKNSSDLIRLTREKNNRTKEYFNRKVNKPKKKFIKR